MYLIVFTLLLLLLLIHMIPWYLGFLGTLLYLLWYFDGKEYTGERRWEAFRRLSIWRCFFSPVTLIFPSSRAEHVSASHGRRLYLIPRCATPVPLVWGIGLHGGQAADFTQPLHYVVPPLFLWIPLIRDVLMWSGAVTYSNYDESKSKINVIMSLLDQGRSVVYADEGVFGLVVVESSSVEEPKSVFFLNHLLEQLCTGQDSYLIPLNVENEEARYQISKPPEWVTNLLPRKIFDYSFPLLYWYRFYNPTKPPPVYLEFGPCMHMKSYGGNVGKLKEVIRENIEGSRERLETMKLLSPTQGGQNFKPTKGS